jgi:hypothetical protein
MAPRAKPVRQCSTAFDTGPIDARDSVASFSRELFAAVVRLIFKTTGESSVPLESMR